jgi:osmotically inducible protein OsmC
MKSLPNATASDRPGNAAPPLLCVFRPLLTMPRRGLLLPAFIELWRSTRICDTAGSGTNPEQLFAAGWSACFMSAMQLVTNKMKVRLPDDGALDAEVDLGTSEGGYVIRARLNVKLPGMDRGTAQAVVDTAHQLCPYSKATRGNIDGVINLV